MRTLIAARRIQYGEGINRYVLRSSDSGKQMWVWVGSNGEKGLELDFRGAGGYSCLG